MSVAVNHFYRFGEFSVDGNQKVLLRDGSPMPLAPKVFETLLILVGASGRIVEKEELMSRLWPDTFVEESNLTFNIQQLRKALGDNARQPRFIETVARRGYRFIAEVKAEARADSPEPTAARPEADDTSARRSLPAPAKSYLWIAAVSVFVIGAVGIASWLTRSRPALSTATAPILSAPFKSESFSSGGVVRAAIRPDGKFVAYTSETDGKTSIWLRRLESAENIQIVPPTDEQYLGIAFSNDGNSLYFVRKPDALSSAIYRVMTFGGIPVKIVGQVEGTVSAAPDDKQLSFMRCNYQDDDFCSLHVIDADGQHERTLLTRQRPYRLAGAQFSPNGKSIAFASGQSWNGGSDFRLMQLDLATGKESRLSEKTFFEITSLKWLPDGDTLLLAAKENLDGRLRIWRVSSATGETQALTKDAVDYASISLDKAGERVIATHSGNTFHLYLAGTDNLSDPKNLATAFNGLAFAPDERIVYEGNDGDIWTISDSGERRQLTNNPYRDYRPRVSPDGRHIFFTSNRTGSNQVWRMNADGTNEVQITKQDGGYPTLVTPDGKWVYFESGLHETLWRVSTDGGDETEVLDGKVFPSGLSRDGKFVAHFLRDKAGLRLALTSLENGKVLKTYNLVDRRSDPVSIVWASDNTLYYSMVKASRSTLWRQVLDDAKPRLVGDFGSEVILHLAVSHDGTRLAFIRGRFTRNAVLIEGLK